MATLGIGVCLGLVTGLVFCLFLVVKGILFLGFRGVCVATGNLLNIFPLTV